MQSRDLMIGDWVVYDDQPYQVKEIHQYGVALTEGKDRRIIPTKDISPVEITVEWLVKQEFVYLKNYDVYEKEFKFDEFVSCIDICLHEDGDGNWFVRRGLGMFCQDIGFCPVNNYIDVQHFAHWFIRP